MKKQEFTENSSGFILFDNEEVIKTWLKEELLKHFRNVDDEVEFSHSPICIIDLYAQDQQGKHILVEVKNWFVTIKDMQQIMKYLVRATEIYGAANFRFILVCGGIEKERRGLLEDDLGVEIFLTKELYGGLFDITE